MSWRNLTMHKGVNKQKGKPEKKCQIASISGLYYIIFATIFFSPSSWEVHWPMMHSLLNYLPALQFDCWFSDNYYTNKNKIKNHIAGGKNTLLVYNHSNFRKQYNCDCQGMYEGWRNPKTGNLPKQVIWRKFWSNKLWHEMNLGKLNNENRRCLDLSLESYTKLFLPLHQLVLCTRSQGRGILKLFTKPEKHNQFKCVGLTNEIRVDWF